MLFTESFGSTSTTKDLREFGESEARLSDVLKKQLDESPPVLSARFGTLFIRNKLS